jgi:ATP-dependent DNA helicase RecQ
VVLWVIAVKIGSIALHSNMLQQSSEQNSILIHKVLKKYWGYDGFRPMQESIILSVMDGNDTIALLPTGAGKSICFQVPAIALQTKTIVISPLIALMQDQVNRLLQIGVKGAALHSGLHYFDLDRILDNFVFGDLNILYLAPERIQSQAFIQRIQKAVIGLVVIDEAHCISQWGHDFRPAYLQISEIRSLFPKTPMMALTATATDHVVNDIQLQLGLQKPALFKTSFLRSNLSLIVIQTENKMAELHQIISKVKGSTIIYVRNRKSTVEYAQWINQQGISCVAYHAGLEKSIREKVFRAWVDNQCRIIVCTNAFGMGIDKADVRLVVHLDIPPSIEEYYQEVGRGGRDQKLAYGVAILQKSNFTEALENVQDQYPELSYIASIYHQLNDFFEIDFGGGQYQQFVFDMNAFSKHIQEPVKKIFHTLNILEREGWLLMSDALKDPSKVMIIADHTQLRFTDLLADQKQKVITYLLRNYEGLFSDLVRIDEDRMSHEIGLELPILERILNILDAERIIVYKPKVDAPQLTFLQSRVIKKSFTIDKKRYSQRKQHAQTRLKSMLSLLEQEDACRMRFITTYFGESASSSCGVCDYCIGVNIDALTPDQIRQIWDHLSQCTQRGQINIHQYVTAYPFNKRKRILAALRQFANERLISIDNHGNISML